MVSLASSDIRYSRAAVVALALAAVFSVVVVVFGFIAVFAPDTMLPTDDIADSSAKFFGDLVAVRNIPLGLAAIFVIVRRERVSLTAVLILSAIVQVGDTVVGLAHGVVSMTVSAGVGAIVYAVAATYMGRRSAAGRLGTSA
ncbi:1,4-dihydroxy-2-naphthoate octaprenyltransferase [Rhodococcus sp. 27YEA15]|uniref:DUF4267 domain-containing protein n=1 Tax=Rhodococcus sp. 27YEA15 TaxID=3156259 RepID=UPI003C7E685C